MNLNTDELFGLIKRKDMLGTLAYIFRENGEEEAAKVVENTTRFTAASVDRMRAALQSELTEASEEVVELVEEVEEEISDQFTDLDALIEVGEYKKAKKLYKAMEESGLGGSEMKARKKAIKKLKD